ncbi:uncharacterized protein PHALS_00878 [Plasmopara halstedii]|uniref:Uncharacterized protein n=1 Tax=Plasmopara halstedii TaxID=4781 RepID=A0A0P1AV37_PLAHL|nr:uncharacterized protein PHALS_00878 [Plasmopara halstedii]CEG44520.1 hypothetical protein PHALS_00878 [Plasmopara halstedii]|eukprot:XP_024580889.1 hypothetical protein PHALS_00878 [Plasmopara halstedii]
MVVSGTLTFHVHRLNTVKGDKPNKKLSVRLAAGNNSVQSKFLTTDTEIEEVLRFNVQASTESEEVLIELLEEGEEKPIVSVPQPLGAFIQGVANQWLPCTFGSMINSHTLDIVYSAEWTQMKQVDKIVPSAETHRPWFMRASYYYETSKNLYDYTTSFRVVKPFAHLGKATVNTVLATVTGKTLFDVDQSLVVPVLNSVDNKVDATISVAFTKLYKGQQFAVNTKNKAVRGVSNVVRKTGNTAVRATNYTTDKVAMASGAVIGTIAGATNFASSQVKHASSSTFGAVRGVTYSVARHIPILGSKIRA